MRTKFLNIIPLLASLTAAIPLHPRQFTPTTNATLVQYLTSTACTGQDFLTPTTISLNQCVDTGAQENDGSISFGNLVIGEGGSDNCYGQVYEYAGCGTSEGDPTQGSFWRQGPVRDVGSPVCFEKNGWADGQAGLGSVMLVCE